MQFYKQIMSILNLGTLPAQIDNSSPVVVSETKELPLSSADNKVTKNESEENPGCSRNGMIVTFYFVEYTIR